MAQAVSRKTCQLGGPGSLPGQSMWDLRRTEALGQILL
jgi:hypothetical protein